MDKTFKGFAVYKRGRKLGKVTFTTYEQARSFARKYLRKQLGNVQGANPAINMFDMTVKRVTT